jgi:hypothetical protein
MRTAPLLFAALLVAAAGCGDGASGSNGLPGAPGGGEDATAGGGGGGGGPAEDAAGEVDGKLPGGQLGGSDKDAFEEDAAPTDDRCPAGSVAGPACFAGFEASDSCAKVWVQAEDCWGNLSYVETPVLPGGTFLLSDVPSGVQKIHIEVGGQAAECTQFVQANTVSDLDTKKCTCTTSPCPAFVPGSCSAWNPLDVCNGKDDDCDGLTDNLCVDLALCEDPVLPFDDCDANGIPDGCPICPSLEMVFVVDTSGSMWDELYALCGAIEDTIAPLAAAGIALDYELLGIASGFECTFEHVLGKYGDSAKGAGADAPRIEACEDGAEGIAESWAAAVGVVATQRQWKPGAIHMIVPISDEGPACGNPVDSKDVQATQWAIDVAKAQGVVVSTIAGTGSLPKVEELAEKLAHETGGKAHRSTNPTWDLSAFITLAVLGACGEATDCNGNGVLDVCDVESGTSADANGDGAPDECDP